MTLLPAAWLGLGAHPLDPMYDVAWARDLCALLALGAGWLELRGRRRAALGLALAMAVVAAGFWSAALRRPYGVLIDPAITRWAADTMVTSRAGGTETFLAGEPGTRGPWRALATRTSPDLVLWIPSLLPPVILLVSALGIALLWPGRTAVLAAILWAGASTGALDALRGVGFLDFLWRRPGRALEWLVGALLVLALSRWRPRRAGLAALAPALVMLAVCARGSPPRLGLADALLLLTLDQHVWLAAGLAGLASVRDPAALVLTAGGAGLVLLSTGLGAVDTWTAAALYRLGLVLAGSQAVEELARHVAGAGLVAGGLARFRHLAAAPERWTTAAVVALVLAGSYVAWWDPSRMDPVARESLAPVPEALAQAADWIAGHTDPQASFVAHADYAPAVAVLAGRRVLRAPGLATAPDDERRRRLEQAVLAGEWPEALRRRYDLRYVFLGPGQFSEQGLESPEALESRGSFRLLYQSDKGLRVYELGEGRR